jgi:polysaccharide biosynthesis/export protein
MFAGCAGHLTGTRAKWGKPSSSHAGHFSRVVRFAVFKCVPFFIAAAVAGCTNLPIDGPAHQDITRGATASLLVGRNQVLYDYVLVDISDTVIKTLPKSASLGSFYSSFGTGATPAPQITVGVGDVVSVTIFETESGGLFIPLEAGMRPGNYVTLPAQSVAKSGYISVPYAGLVRAVGRTPQQIQADIELKLVTRAVEPQVIVTLGEQTATSVSIVSDSGSSRFQLRANERVLDVLARAAALKYPGYETFITLLRKGQNTTVYFPTLIRDTRENIYVAARDTLYVYREQQKYIAIGALGAGGQTTGVTGYFPFEQEALSLNEAIAKAGGLLDSRANASQVFLYRLEYRDALERMGVNVSKFPPDEKLIRTVYRANFRDPSSFFSAQNFAVRHKDVIYVANADSVELEKFMLHTRAITSTIAGTAGDLSGTRQAVRQLGQ